MGNIRGRVRGHLSSLRAGFALVHLNMIRLAVMATRKELRSYANATFKLYLQSLCREIRFIDLTEVLDVIGADPEVVCVKLIDVNGYRGRPDWERIVLAAAARHLGSYPCFEIGTAAGNTTMLLANNTDAIVYSLDLADSDDMKPSLVHLGSDDAIRAARKRAEFVRLYPQKNVFELVGDSAQFDFSPYANRIGLFFVDGAHSVEYVRSDTFNAAFCCRLDGLIVWDDFTTSRDVTRFIRWLSGLGVDIYGVSGTKLALSRDIGRLRAIAQQHGINGKVAVKR